MNSTLFYNSFSFHTYSFKRALHNDNSAGITSRFFGRIISGSCRIVTRDTELSLKAGDMFYLPHHLSYHSYWYPDSVSGSVEWESYRFDFIPDERNRCFYLQQVFPSREALALLDKVAKNRPHTIEDIGNFYAFMGAVIPSMEEAKSNPRQALFDRCESYIFKHPDFRVSELARHLGVSESGLYSFLRDFADTTPVKIKNRMQAERAVSLLTYTDLSVEEISGKLGFQSTAYFRKIVKEHKGLTPAEIRKNSRMGENI